MRRIGFAVLVATLALSGGAALGIGGAPVAEGESQPRAAASVLAQNTQVSSGQQVYVRVCASCHGDSGEGIDDAPPIMGDGNALSDYRTAARLYAFISSEMPDDDPGTLSSREYYDVLAYLLDQNGMIASGQAVEQSTVADISLAP